MTETTLPEEELSPQAKYIADAHAKFAKLLGSDLSVRDMQRLLILARHFNMHPTMIKGKMHRGSPRITSFAMEVSDNSRLFSGFSELDM